MQWTAEGHVGQHPVTVTFTLEGREGCTGTTAQPFHRTHALGWVAAATLIGQFQNEASAWEHLRRMGFTQNLKQHLASHNAKAKLDATHKGAGMVLNPDFKFWSDLAIYTPAQLQAHLTSAA
jgi:hypothetical protein